MIINLTKLPNLGLVFIIKKPNKINKKQKKIMTLMKILNKLKILLIIIIMENNQKKINLKVKNYNILINFYFKKNKKLF